MRGRIWEMDKNKRNMAHSPWNRSQKPTFRCRCLYNVISSSKYINVANAANTNVSHTRNGDAPRPRYIDSQTEAIALDNFSLFATTTAKWNLAPCAVQCNREVERWKLVCSFGVARCTRMWMHVENFLISILNFVISFCTFFSALRPFSALLCCTSHSPISVFSLRHGCSRITTRLCVRRLNTQMESGWSQGRDRKSETKRIQAHGFA